jgi:hypothetical protein
LTPANTKPGAVTQVTQVCKRLAVVETVAAVFVSGFGGGNEKQITMIDQSALVVASHDLNMAVSRRRYRSRSDSTVDKLFVIQRIREK